MGIQDGDGVVGEGGCELGLPGRGGRVDRAGEEDSCASDGVGLRGENYAVGRLWECGWFGCGHFKVFLLRDLISELKYHIDNNDRLLDDFGY